MTAQQLKNSILQMAVQGKLVPQDPNDEPAYVLLERIRAEKEQMVKEGKIKKEKNPSIIFRGDDNLPYERVGNSEPVCIADEVSFEIPDSWEWVRIKNFCIDVFSGKSPKYEKNETGYRVIGQAANQQAGINYASIKYTNASFWEEMPGKYFLQKDDVLLNTLGNGTLGRSGIITDLPFDLLTDGHLFVFRNLNHISSLYFYYFLQANQETIIKTANGSTNQTFLSLNSTMEWMIPVPPLSEQFRIVEKINKSLPSLSNYSCKESELSLLNQTFPEQIKKSILQQAVQGKLVPQDPADEPASVLLERIRAEKEQMIRDGKIKRDKHESIIFRRDDSFYENVDGVERCIDDEVSFEIPESWEWARLRSVAIINPRNNIVDDCDAAFMPMTLLMDGYRNAFSYETKKWHEIKSGFTHFSEGDIVIAKITPCFQNRKSAIVSELPNGIGAGTTELHVVRNINNTLDSEYLLWLFKTSYFIDNGVKAFTGTAGQQRVGKEYMANFLVPVPPRNEQHRIVKTITALLSIIENSGVY